MRKSFVLLGIFALIFSVGIVGAQNDTETDPRVEVAQSVLQQLFDEDYDGAYAQLDPSLLSLISRDQLESAWSGLLAQVGEYHGQLAVTQSETNGVHVVTITLDFELLAIDAHFSFEGDNRLLVGFLLSPNTNPPRPEGEPIPLPAYINVDAFTETEVTVGAGTAWELPATLTLPTTGDGALLPAVILVHGSGAHDRDETYGANKVFRDVAQGLASQGIAVLRYDKRTLHYQEIEIATFTAQEEVIDDVIAAFTLLQNTEGVDPARIFVLGHSLGGFLAPRIAEQLPEVAGIIVAAGAMNETLQDAVVRQTEYIIGLDGTISPQEEAALQQMLLLQETVNALTPESDPTMVILGGGAAYWFDLTNYDAIATAQAIDTPLLVLNGDRDYQVPIEGFEVWRDALDGREDTTFIAYEGLNHFLMFGEGDPNPDEYLIPAFVDETFINDVAAWVNAH